jgi:hypothetical protein
MGPYAGSRLLYNIAEAHGAQLHNCRRYRDLEYNARVSWVDFKRMHLRDDSGRSTQSALSLLNINLIDVSMHYIHMAWVLDPQFVPYIDYRWQI